MVGNEIRVSIIGAGASGVISMSRLVENLSQNLPQRKKIRMFLFDKVGTFGPGLAYSTPLESHLINMRADTMSAVLENPTHFVDWMRSHELEIKQEFPDIFIEDSAYPPRKLYGRYLADIGDKARERANGGNIEIEFVAGEVIEIKEKGSEKELALKDGTAFSTDYVILAPGNFPPTVLLDLRGAAEYFPYPWPAEKILEGVSPSQPVCIIGAGLSAIDTLFTLLENGHQEKIYFVSRNGVLPKVQGEPKNYSLQHFTENLARGLKQPLSLNQIADLLIREIEEAEGRSIDWLHIVNPAKSVKDILEADISEAKKGPIPSQTVLLETADIVGRIWNALSPQAQRRFDCDYKTLWNVHRHPMPIINAKRVLNALRSEQLEVFSGFKCAGYLGEGKGFHIDLKTRFGLTYSLKVPFFINATGQGLAVANYDDILIQNLLSRGVITPHHSGGIQVDFETSGVTHRDGTQSTRLFAVGEITRGVHFFTNAISQNARCAGNIAAYITKSINNMKNY